MELLSMFAIYAIVATVAYETFFGLCQWYQWASQSVAYLAGLVTGSVLGLTQLVAAIWSFLNNTEEDEHILQQHIKLLTWKASKAEQRATHAEAKAAEAAAEAQQLNDKVHSLRQIVHHQAAAISTLEEDKHSQQVANQMLAMEKSTAEQRALIAETKAEEMAASMAEMEAFTLQMDNTVVELEENMAILNQKLLEAEYKLNKSEEDEHALQDAIQKLAIEKSTATTAEQRAVLAETKAEEMAASMAEMEAFTVHMDNAVVELEENVAILNQKLLEAEYKLNKSEEEKLQHTIEQLDNAKLQASSATAVVSLDMTSNGCDSDKQYLLEQLEESNIDIDVRVLGTEAYASNDWAKGEIPITAALVKDGPCLRADVIDGGVQPEFSCNTRWNDLREEGAAKGWLLHPDSIKRGKVIGRGTYGTVYEAECRGVQAVVKCVQVRHSNCAEEEKQVESFSREVETLSHLDHSNILPFQGACMKSYDECWLVTEYLPGGDLAKWLHGAGTIRKPKRTVAERLKMALGIAKGMQAMHESVPAIIHRDLKPSNVFIDASNNARVADMGLARHLLPGDYLTNCTGTMQYMAPEVLDGDPYDWAADVFSFGITLWEICTQHKPYEDLQLTAIQVATRVVEYEEFRPNIKKKMPKEVPSSILFMCQRCWSAAPELRPSFTEIVETLREIMQERHLF